MANESAEKNRNDRPNAMDVYNFLWRGRDFELSHLWQRSVFLAMFLLGIASAYGVYFKDVFLKLFQTEEQAIGCNQIFIFGIVPMAIAILGVVFSKLWIMMAKGSKAWQEIYEDSIAKMSGIREFWNAVIIEECDRNTGKFLSEEFLFGNLSLKDATKCDKCLLSTAGGAFSVSKINVMIGIVFLLMFGVLACSHAVWTVCALLKLYNLLTISNCSCLFVILFVLLLIMNLIFMCCCIKKKCSSSYLEEFVK